MPNVTILVAEDDDMVRAFVCSGLRRHGYRVLEAQDGAAALALAERVGLRRIDLVLTDVEMPALDGIELARCLRQLRPDVKVLHMTGSSAARLDKLGSAGGVLQKPFAYGTLLRGVDACLSKEKTLRAEVRVS